MPAFLPSWIISVRCGGRTGPRSWQQRARAEEAMSAFLLLALLLLGPKCAHAAHWAQATELDRNFAVFWSPGEDNITFELQVRTLGYVGFGFSADGTMTNADMVIGWVYNTEVILQDRHSRGHAEPVLDATDDYELLLGYENGTHTVLRFRRRYHTCDHDDFPITNDTMRLLYAYHSEEPGSATAPLPYHGQAQRGSRSIYLLQRSDPRQPLPPDLVAWELRNPMVTLPAGEDTLFWCKIFKLPNLRRKHHMVRYEPLQQASSRRYMHHVIIYECSGVDMELEMHTRDAGQPCYQPNMPRIFNNCSSVVVAWARGSEGFSFPAEAGYPLDPDKGPRYFMMETHYVNPDGDADVTDSTGVRLYHTGSLRRYDAGVLSVGVDPKWRHIIPPGQPDVLSQGHCISQCTRQALPHSGINVFAVILHTHLIGRKVILRHLRDGEELPPIAADNNYDYNYQEYRRLQKPIKVYPGDHLITDCVYDSQSRKTITLGGLTTREEMCLAYTLYYPRVDLALCHSLPSLPTVLHSLGIQELCQGSSPVKIKAPPELADMTLEERLIKYDWETNFRTFQDTIHRGSYQPRCWLKQLAVLPGTQDMEAFYPNITRPFQESSTCPSGRLKKPRRRKKPGDVDYEDEDDDPDASENVLDGDSDDKTKVYTSSMGVLESSPWNNGPIPAPPIVMLGLLATVCAFLTR